MGTRSLTKVIRSWKNESGEKENQPITCMYRQFDGYMEGHGQELAEFLSQFTIVNGIGLNEEKKIANGMDCLAAQMFAHFKDGPGGIYCMHPDTADAWQDYEYEVEKNEDGNLIISVYGSSEGKKIFKGTPRELLDYISELV